MMKKLKIIKQNHLKKRALLELIGFGVLVWVCVSQRHVIVQAVSDIRRGDVFYLGALLLFYWAMLPIAVFGYILLSTKKLSLAMTCLAQLSGAGPARIIPGGLGQISVGARYLSKSGIKLDKAILIVVTNNLIGIFTNIILLTIAMFVHSNILERILHDLTGRYLLVFILVILVFAMLIFLLSHARATKKIVKKVKFQWGSMLISLRKSPKKLVLLFLDATAITLGHTFMIFLSAKALSINITIVDALIALSAGIFIGGVIPTPGGLGAVEAGTMSALVVLGYSAPDATSIALLFRTANYWQPLIPGMFSYLYLREKKLL